VTAFGFALFGAGSFVEAFATPRSDFTALLLPQILRGFAVLFCILPITNVALEEQPSQLVANASGLLNLMRNLGGAVGIGLVDTIINVRPHAIGTQIVAQLRSGSSAEAAFVGLPAYLFHGVPVHITLAQAQAARPLVERAAATAAFNEAWVLLGACMVASLAALPLLRTRRVSTPARGRYEIA
jgi:DHA2 family multidrug resistance protein